METPVLIVVLDVQELLLVLYNMVDLLLRGDRLEVMFDFAPWQLMG